MTEQFAWIANTAVGEFLRPMDHAPRGTIFDVIPPGFAAYARVFHPVWRYRPATEKSWAGLDMYEYTRNSMVTGSEIEHELCSWAAVAQAFGTHMHPQAQYLQLAQLDSHNVEPNVAADGWSYSAPEAGSLDPLTLSALASALARHTITPALGIAAIWEGYGGLLSSGIRTNELASGLLSQDISQGPRLSLDGGAWNYFLFRAGAQDLVDGSWAERAPWVKPGFSPQSPTYLWPDDQAWVLHTNVDLDSSIIGGSQELVDQLLRAPGVEAFPLPVNADLSRYGDSMNPPPPVEVGASSPRVVENSQVSGEKRQPRRDSTG